MNEIKLGCERFTYGGLEAHFFFPANDDTHYGTLSAFVEGTFLLDKVRFEDGDIVLDLGCNVGILSCLIAKMFPFVTVYGFDPSPVAFSCANLNAVGNNRINARFFQKAVGAKNRKNVEFVSNSKEISALVEKDLSVGFTDSYMADVITLNDIFGSPLIDIPRVKYLKVDIEGGEYELMKDLCTRPDLVERIDNLHLEVHGYPWRDELNGMVKQAFGSKWLNG